MSVEQDGLGTRVILSVFYEVELTCTITQWNSGSAKKGSLAVFGGGEAFLGCFVAMKLDDRARHLAARSDHLSGGRIHEQQHRRDKGR